MKKFLFALTATLVFVLGCKKDDDDNGGTSENPCKISTVQYYDSGQVAQTGTYTYTGNQITKVQFNNYNLTFTYTGNNISKRNYFFSAGVSPEIYDTIIYNSDNTISKIETFARSNTGSYSSALRIEFVYAGGKLSKTRYLDISGGASDVFMENTFNYTGNNITSLNFVNLADTTQGTVNYTYDTNPNHFKKQNSQAYLVDLLFNPLLLDEQGSLLPIAFSENNVTGISNTQIGYVSDDRNNLKDITIAGLLFARYSYLCQ